MTLKLVMIRCPDNVAPERREVRGGEFSIGRGKDNYIVFPRFTKCAEHQIYRLVASISKECIFDWNTFNFVDRILKIQL